MEKMYATIKTMVLLAGLSVVCVFTSVVAAQEPADEQEESSSAANQKLISWADPWRFNVNVYMWALDAPTTLKVGNKEIHKPGDFSNIFDALNFAAMFEVEAHKGPLGFFVSPIYADLEADAKFIGPLGRDNKATVRDKMWLIDYGVSYEIGRWKLGSDADAPVLTLEPYGGFLYIQNDMTVKYHSSLLNRNIDDDETININTPIVGARAKLDLTKRWYFAGSGNYGGWGVDDVNRTWELLGMIGYRFKMWNCDSNVFAGYRYLVLASDSGPASLDLTLKGPFIGLGWEF